MINSLLPLKTPDGAFILNFKVHAERKEVIFSSEKLLIDFYSFTGKSMDGKQWKWVALKAVNGLQSVIVKWRKAEQDNEHVVLSLSEIYNSFERSKSFHAA